MENEKQIIASCESALEAALQHLKNNEWDKACVMLQLTGDMLSGTKNTNHEPKGGD